MQPATDRPSLLPFAGSAYIPKALKANNRWAPWRAVWNVKRSKYDKTPVRADVPERGLSTANPDRWFTFDAALAAHTRAAPMTSGIGYVVTRPHGVVGIDLDGAVTDGVVDEWAQEIVERVGGYAEISPSGNGLRIFVFGEIDADYVNHHVGVEVYAGHHPRFLTVSGRHLPGTPTDVVQAKPGALAWLAETYRESAREKTQGDAPTMPDLLAEDELPALDSLNLPPRARDFLTSGEAGDDRSRTLHSTTVALFTAGLNEAQVFSLLVENPHSFEVALDHRRQIPHKAETYIWEHHVVKAKPKAMGSILTAADFDEVEREYEEADDDEPGQPADKKPAARYPFKQAAVFAAESTHIEWLVPGVLPKAEVCSVFGESGAGKSFFTIDMGLRLAAGLPWWGKTLDRRRVAYVAAEGAVGVRLRLRALAQTLDVDLAEIDLYLLDGQPNLLQPQDVSSLVHAVRDLGGIDAIFLDTLAQMTPGANENSSEDMSRALAHSKTLSQKTGATVIHVAHSGKNAALGQRGWSGQKGAMDAQIEVTRTATYRAARVVKLKDGQGEGVEYQFKLAEVLVGLGPDGAPITSCVVEPIGEVANAGSTRKKRAPARGVNQTLVLQTLEDLASAGNAKPHRTLVVDSTVERMTPPSGRDTRAQRVREALDALVAERVLSVDGEGRIAHQQALTDLGAE